MIHPTAVIMEGPQGSGKGTQAQLAIARCLELEIPFGQFFLGDTLRDLKKTEGVGDPVLRDLYKHIPWDLMAKGELLPDRYIYALMEHALDELDTETKFIFVDGIPRNEEQAAHTVPYLRGIGCKRVVVINLELDRATCIKRITSKPRGRSDDNDPDALNRRLDIFHRELVHVNRKLVSLGSEVHNVAASGSESVILDRVWNLLTHQGQPQPVSQLEAQVA